MEKFTQIKAELDKLQTSFSEISNKFKKSKKIKADDTPKEEGDMDEMMCQLMDNMNARFGYVWQAFDDLYNFTGECNKKIESHSQVGHLPKMDAGQLSKSLEKLGLADSYEVKKPVLYASKNRRGNVEFIA